MGETHGLYQIATDCFNLHRERVRSFNMLGRRGESRMLRLMTNKFFSALVQSPTRGNPYILAQYKDLADIESVYIVTSLGTELIPRGGGRHMPADITRVSDVGNTLKAGNPIVTSVGEAIVMMTEIDNYVGR